MSDTFDQLMDRLIDRLLRSLRHLIATTFELESQQVFNNLLLVVRLTL